MNKPDLQVIQSSATLIEVLSKLPFEALVPGSESVGNTKVKPEVFMDPAKWHCRRRTGHRREDEV